MINSQHLHNVYNHFKENFKDFEIHLCPPNPHPTKEKGKKVGGGGVGMGVSVYERDTERGGLKGTNK